MKSIIDVNTGEVNMSSQKDMLRSLAIGSCVVVAAYDPRNRIGGMAHVMLPGSAPTKEVQKTKYATNAVSQMLDLMAGAGSSEEDIEVCLVGAGNVLKKADDTICRENSRSIIEFLGGRNIPIRASVLGGTKRKGVFLDVESGRVTYSEGDSKEQVLWESELIG